MRTVRVPRGGGDPPHPPSRRPPRRRLRRPPLSQLRDGRTRGLADSSGERLAPPPPASSTAPSVGPGWRFQLPYWTSRPRERARSGGEGHQEEARLPLSRRPSRCEGLSSCIKVKAGGGRGVYRANGVPKLCLSIANVSMTIHDHAFHKQVLPSSGMEFNVLFILFLTLLPAHARLSDVYRSSSHSCRANSNKRSKIPVITAAPPAGTRQRA